MVGNKPTSEYFETPDKSERDQKDYKGIQAHVLKHRHWLLTEKNKYIADISLSELQLFAEELLQQIYVQALIQGNLQQEMAFEVMATVMRFLNGGSVKEETKHSAGYVEQCIEAFHQDINSILNELCLEGFENFKSSVIKLKEIKDATLYEEVCRNWSEITTGECFFERRSKEIEILKTLEKQDILQFWLKHNTDNLRTLTIQVVGRTTEQSAEAINEISNDEHIIDSSI